MTQYLSFDIGGTNLKYALLDQAGDILEKNKVPTPTEGLDQFLDVVYQIADFYQGNFDGIAVSAPGKIDTKEKIIYFGGSLPFLNGLNLEEKLGARYQVPIGIENDGKAAALAELWLGELNGISDGAAIVLGTGIGGGIIVNGRLIRGHHFQAGELSFMKTQKDLVGVDSLAGMEGSAVGMVEAINQAVGNSDSKDGLAAFKALDEGHKKAQKILENYGRLIAMVILNVQSVVDLQRYVIGGGISAQPRVIEEINRQYVQMIEEIPLLDQTLARPEIVQAKFQNDANIYGALYALLLQMNGEE